MTIIIVCVSVRMRVVGDYLSRVDVHSTTVLDIPPYQSEFVVRPHFPTIAPLQVPVWTFPFLTFLSDLLVSCLGNVSALNRRRHFVGQHHQLQSELIIAEYDCHLYHCPVVLPSMWDTTSGRSPTSPLKHRPKRFVAVLRLAALSSQHHGHLETSRVVAERTL